MVCSTIRIKKWRQKKQHYEMQSDWDDKTASQNDYQR